MTQNSNVKNIFFFFFIIIIMTISTNYLFISKQPQQQRQHFQLITTILFDAVYVGRIRIFYILKNGKKKNCTTSRCPRPATPGMIC